MRVFVVLLAGVLVTSAAADDQGILVDATRQISQTVAESVRNAIDNGSHAHSIRRVGVAPIVGDDASLRDTIQSALIKSGLEVVLTDDADWEPLLAELERQDRRSDIIVQDTAHSVGIQGVDAVLFGTVGEPDITCTYDGLRRTRNATVRATIHLASIAEDSPGTLVWSDQLVGNAQTSGDVQPFDWASDWVVANRYAVAVLLGLLLLLVVMNVFHRALAPR